jgi:hypothetical protein
MEIFLNFLVNYLGTKGLSNCKLLMQPMLSKLHAVLSQENNAGGIIEFGPAETFLWAF